MQGIPPFAPALAGAPNSARGQAMPLSWPLMGATPHAISNGRMPADSGPYPAAVVSASGTRDAALEALHQHVSVALRDCFAAYADPDDIPPARVAVHCLARTGMQLCGDHDDPWCVETAQRTFDVHEPAMPEPAPPEQGTTPDFEAALREVVSHAIASPAYDRALKHLHTTLLVLLPDGIAAPVHMHTRQALLVAIQQRGALAAFRSAAMAQGLRMRGVLDQIAAEAYQLRPERTGGAGAEGFRSWLDARYPSDPVVRLTHLQLMTVLDALADYLNRRYAQRGVIHR